MRTKGMLAALQQTVSSGPPAVRRWWNKPGFWKLQLAFFVTMGVLIWVFMSNVTGWYEWLWLNTTRKPFTYIMRDTPWLLLLPGLAIVSVIVFAIWQLSPSGIFEGITAKLRRAQLLALLRERLLTRVIFLVNLFIALGFIFGHVLWGTDLRESRGVHNGVEVKLWITGVSSREGVGADLRSWLGSQVATVPELHQKTGTNAPGLYVFTNGVGRRGSLGFQPDVLESAPGDPEFTQMYRVYTARWWDGTSARQLASTREVEVARAGGELEIAQTDVIVNAPVKEWGKWGQ